MTFASSHGWLASSALMDFGTRSALFLASALVMMLARVSASGPGPASCAGALHCHRHGRPPLRAGGKLGPFIGFSGSPSRRQGPRRARRSAPPDACRGARANVTARYAAALASTVSDVRVHSPTLLEYARRVGNIAAVVADGDAASLAFARAAIEAGESVRGGGGLVFRYRAYGAKTTAGLLEISQLIQQCWRNADFAFRGHGVLDDARQLDSYTQSPELLLIDTASRKHGQLSRVLEALDSQALRYIIVHDVQVSVDISSFGPHVTEGTCNPEQRDFGIGSWMALEEWLGGPPVRARWELLECSLAGQGLAVLGRRSLDVPSKPGGPKLENSTQAGCSKNSAMFGALGQARALARKLTTYHVNFPGMLGGAISLDRVVLREVRRRLRQALRHCPTSLEAQALLKVVSQLRRGSCASNAEGCPQKFGVSPETARGHPDMLFLAATEASDTEQKQQLFGEFVQRWPWRREGWEGLVASLSSSDQGASPGEGDERRERMAHAWRRLYALAGRDRHAVSAALFGLQQLGHTAEAAASWERAARPSPCTLCMLKSLWDDPRRFPSATPWRESATDQAAGYTTSSFLEAHPEFAEGLSIAQSRWQILREEMLTVVQSTKATEVNGYCQDDGRCSYLFLAYESCRFLAACDLVPQLCAASAAMEAKGLHLVRVALSLVGGPEHGSPSHVLFQAHASERQARMRLSCTVFVSKGTVSIMRIEGEEPRVYEEGGCFWFDESFTHEVDYSAEGPDRLRMTIYFDALHPGYYSGAHDVEVSPRPGSLGAWQRFLSGESLGQACGGRGCPPDLYHVEAPAPRRWVSLAATLVDRRENAYLCFGRDEGALFHRVAFGDYGGDWAAVGLLLQIYNLIDRFASAPEEWIQPWVRRMQRVTEDDVFTLTNNIWACMAHGCDSCKAMEVSGLCEKGLSYETRQMLLRLLVYIARIPMAALHRWFQILGVPLPPPDGWGFSGPEATQRIHQAQVALAREFPQLAR